MLSLGTAPAPGGVAPSAPPASTAPPATTGATDASATETDMQKQLRRLAELAIPSTVRFTSPDMPPSMSQLRSVACRLGVERATVLKDEPLKEAIAKKLGVELSAINTRIKLQGLLHLRLAIQQKLNSRGYAPALCAPAACAPLCAPAACAPVCAPAACAPVCAPRGRRGRRGRSASKATVEELLCKLSGGTSQSSQSSMDQLLCLLGGGSKKATVAPAADTLEQLLCRLSGGTTAAQSPLDQALCALTGGNMGQPACATPEVTQETQQKLLLALVKQMEESQKCQPCAPVSAAEQLVQLLTSGSACATRDAAKCAQTLPVFK